MKLERSKDWWMARAHREGAAAVGAGSLALDPKPEKPLAGAQGAIGAVEETRIAFGRFVNLMRRRYGYSMEELALAADLEAAELLGIEDDIHHIPEPRSVFKLAQTFKVSQQRLMQLAGLAVANDASFRREAVRFAARSESVEKLTPEESSALETFVVILSEKELSK